MGFQDSSTVQHSCVKFGDPSCIGLRYCAEKQTDRQIDKQTDGGKYPILDATAVSVGNNNNNNRGFFRFLLCL